MSKRHWNPKRCARLIALALLLAGLTAILSGCWSATEINELAIVMAIGIDQGQDSQHYHVTAQVALPADLKASGTEAGKAYVNFEHEALGLNTTMRELMLKASRKVYTMHNQMIILGMEVTENDIGVILDYFIRNSEARFNISVLVADGKASEILNEDATLEGMPATHIQDMLNIQKETGEVFVASIFDVLVDMLSVGMEATIPIVSLEEADGEMRAVLTETAVFRDAKMVGRLSIEQTRDLLILRNRISGGSVVVQTADGYVSLELYESHATIKPLYENGAFRIEVDVQQSLTMVDTNIHDDINSAQNIALIRRLVEEQTVARLQSTLKYAQSFGADIFGFGEMLYRKYPKVFTQLVDDWPDSFPTLPVIFGINVNITGSGSILSPVNPAGEAPADERWD